MDKQYKLLKDIVIPAGTVFSRAPEKTTRSRGHYEFGEVIPNQVLSIRHVEDAIMRQGMFLKAVGNPNPYPQSYNPESSVVEPTADNLKL